MLLQSCAAKAISAGAVSWARWLSHRSGQVAVRVIQLSVNAGDMPQITMPSFPMGWEIPSTRTKCGLAFQAGLGEMDIAGRRMGKSRRGGEVEELDRQQKLGPHQSGSGSRSRHVVNALVPGKSLKLSFYKVWFVTLGTER